MNYGELKTRVLAEAHRPDLTGDVADFISSAEGMIRRELVAMPQSVTLDEDDRVSGGVYTLPVTASQVRAVYATFNGETYALQQVSLEEIRRLPSTYSRVAYFCVIGDTIEFRGIPETDAELELHFFGHPVALSDDNDENDLLTNHETLYVDGSLFFLHKRSQDLELAQGALDTFTNAVEKLNEQMGRKLGGARVAAAYHFGPIGRYGY